MLKKKQKAIKSFVKGLDDVFSIYIRKRDSDENGYGRCVTCPRYDHYTKMDCGHFITRKEKAVRWDEKNCALQCKSCNGFAGGEQHLFAKAIDRRWGEGTADLLQIKRRSTYKLDRFELQTLINYYKEKI